MACGFGGAAGGGRCAGGACVTIFFGTDTIRTGGNRYTGLTALITIADITGL